MALVSLMCLLAMQGFQYVLPEVYVSTECYGNALSISCEEGQRIKVIDDFFGVSGPSVDQSEGSHKDGCQYHPGDCTVTNNRYSSLIHRFCEGKGKCTNFQVDRRYCGVNHTNYEQVEYECVNDKDIIDMCSTTSMSSQSAYLATPNFPNQYPPAKDCMCTLWAATEGVGIRLEATHFVVKYDRPCKDWVEIDSGRHKRRICGAYRSTIVSDFFQVTFHSDAFQGHQGAWLHFSSYPQSSNVTIHATCRPETYLPAKVLPSPTPTTTPPPPAVTDLHFLLTHESDNNTRTIQNTSQHQYVTQNTTLDKSSHSGSIFGTTENPDGAVAVTEDSSRVSQGHVENKVQGIIINSEENIVLGKTDEKDILTPNSIPPNKTAESKSETAVGKVRQNLSKQIYIKNPNQINSVLKSRAVRTTSAKPFVGWNERDHKSERGVHGASFIVEAIPGTPPKLPSIEEVPSVTNKQGDQTESDLSELLRTPFHSKHITGVIIISICVGGILVLVLVLGVLVCVNRSKKPKRSLSRQRRRNERLQERLNTLSFYDSIPLYDSIGHRGGVARAPVPFNMADTSTDLDLTASSAPLPTPCPVTQSPLDTHHRGPYWTSFHRNPIQDTEFESSLYIDSSIYASLNRSFTSGDRTRSMVAIPGECRADDQEIPSSHTSTEVQAASEATQQGEESHHSANPVGLNISYHCEEEDICTHV